MCFKNIIKFIYHVAQFTARAFKSDNSCHAKFGGGAMAQSSVQVTENNIRVGVLTGKTIAIWLKYI